MTKPIGYVLLSGGIDSTTALSRAVDVDELDIVRAVSIDYGQRHRREIAAAADIARVYGAEHVVINMHFVERTMLTDASIPVPDISYDQISGVSPTFVPFRNGMMLSRLAAHIAERHLDPTRKYNALDLREGIDNPRLDPDYQRDALIYWGAHAEDAAGGAYPDCSQEFAGAMANAIYVGTYNKVRVVTPFISLMKHEIIEMGSRHGAPYQLTWSCYKGGELHCGTCATCLARKAAFERAGIVDPTTYAA